ncbi:MAG TPA: imidazolonepropionase [Puia sp.]|nr:imidazolonepropionase [Puia sp.]
MQSKLLINIKQLVNTSSGHEPLYGKEMTSLPCIENAWLLIEGNEIAAFGKMASLNKEIPSLPEQQIDCSGRFVLPSWCDSHSHIVFAGSRENEFVDKIKGVSYAEINARGGGILNTVQLTNEISEDELFRISWKRLDEIKKLGTGAIEIKSGYGLTLEGELKMLRVIKKLKEKSGLLIKSTFLGAHTYPSIFRDDHSGYLNELVNVMLPVIAKEKLADFIDVFCENGFFSAEESEFILRAGMQYGLKPKMHVNQLNSIGGIAIGIKIKALSLDHLETMQEKDFIELENSGWQGICTLLPTAAFFLRLPFPSARRLVESGLAIALASDYNPGSSPSGNMNLVIAMACIQMKLLPEEALNAATINGAFAMGLGHSVGTISVGKIANLIISSPVPSLAYLPYSFGNGHIDKIIVQGDTVV